MPLHQLSLCSAGETQWKVLASTEPRLVAGRLHRLRHHADVHIARWGPVWRERLHRQTPGKQGRIQVRANRGGLLGWRRPLGSIRL